LKWDRNFYTGKVGGKALIDRVQTPGALNNGEPLNYAWGLQVGQYRGLRVVEHSGSLGGYRAHLARYPEQHVRIAVLCNISAATPGTLARQMADIVMAASPETPSLPIRVPAPDWRRRRASLASATSTRAARTI